MKAGTMRNISALIEAAKQAKQLGFGARCKQGRGQLVDVGYDKRGVSTVTPLTEWLDGAALLAAVTAWPRH